MTRRFRKSDITIHHSREYSGPAVNVKVYKFPHDVDGISAAQSEFGCTAELAGKALEYAYESAQRQFWSEAEEKVREIFGPSAKAYSMGRSGGWLYVDGIGADNENWGFSKEWQSWNAAEVAKWGRLVRWCEDTIAAVTSWEFAKGEVEHYLDMTAEEEWKEQVRKAAPALLTALKKIHDEADHALGTEADDRLEVFAVNTETIRTLARVAIEAAEGREVTT